MSTKNTKRDADLCRRRIAGASMDELSASSGLSIHRLRQIVSAGGATRRSRTRDGTAHTNWAPVIERAAEIVASYDTGVTLRQTFYRLVAAELIPNTPHAYSRLSHLTAEARRDGWFPDFIDTTREVHEPGSFASAKDARAWLRTAYRHDRAANQPVSLWLGVEKRGHVAQLTSWFGERGIPVLSLGGYASQSYADTIARRVKDDGRPADAIRRPGAPAGPDSSDLAGRRRSPPSSCRGSRSSCPTRSS